MGYNNINHIDELSSLYTLVSLSVNNNNITNVNGLSKLSNLSNLDISNNQIKDISPIRKLPNLLLTSIDFTGNPLPEYVFKDKLNQQLILSMLYPYIDEAVKNYYGEFRQYMDAGILNISQTKEEFILKIRIETFVGPHNPPYGIDTLTINKNNGEIKVEEFKHEDVN